MKYLITENFETNISNINNALSIPSIKASNYATPQKVTNEKHVDFDKFIIPIKTEGSWKCDYLFNPEELVDHDSSWAKPQEEFV